MCDYSLMMMDSRLAVAGEQLVAHRFRSGSTGLVSLAEFQSWQERPRPGLWQRCKECFSSRNEPVSVVCIPPGSRLRLDAIPSGLRRQFDLDACEEVTFTQISADANWHRDALTFPGKAANVLLQYLPEGQMVTVLQLSSSGAGDPDPELARYAPAHR